MSQVNTLRLRSVHTFVQLSGAKAFVVIKPKTRL